MALMSRRGISSERIARGVLERMGFKVLSSRQRIITQGIEVGEVDLVAESPEGEKYSVEVKAGRASVTDVRQAYSNAKLLGLKPMLICKGYSDAAAEVVAKELGVEVIELPQFYLLLEAEDLETVVRQAVMDALEDYEAPMVHIKVEADELKALKALASASSWEEAANLVGGHEKLEVYVSRLKSKGVLKPARGFKGIRRQASRALSYLMLNYRLKRVEKALKRLLRSLNHPQPTSNR